MRAWQREAAPTDPLPTTALAPFGPDQISFMILDATPRTGRRSESGVHIVWSITQDTMRYALCVDVLAQDSWTLETIPRRHPQLFLQFISSPARETP